MVALASAYVRLRLDTSGVKGDVERGLRGAGGERAAHAKGTSIGQAFSKGFDSGGSTFGRVAATMAARATIATSAVAASTPVMAKFVAAVAPAAGVLAGIVPAAAGVAAVSATMNFALGNTVTVMKKGLTGAKGYEDALEGLVPAQRAVVEQVVGMKGRFDGLQQSVSQRFFAPFAADIAPLVDTYLPVADRQMGSLADRLGQLGHQVLATARTAPVVRAVVDVFQETGFAVGAVTSKVGPLGQAVARLVSSSLPILRTMTGDVGTLADRFTRWANEAAKSGRLVGIFNNARVVIGQLIAIFGNLGAIVREVFALSNGGAGNLLAKLVLLTGQMHAWVSSSEGARTISAHFRTMAELGGTLRSTLAGVLPEVAESLRIGAPAASVFAAAVGRIIVSMGPLLPAITGVTVQILTALVPAMNGLARLLGENQGLLQAIAPFLIGYAVASKAVAVAVGAKTIAIRAWAIAVGVAKGLQAGWTALTWLAVAPVHAHTAAMRLSTSTIGTWVGVKAIEARAWASTAAATVASTAGVVGHRIAVLASTTATKASALATAAWTAVTAGSAAALGAARAGVLALNLAMRANPIGAVITAVTLLVGALVILYQRNETVRKIIDAAWKAIKTAVAGFVDWFTGTALPNARAALSDIGGFFQGLGRVAKSVWEAITGTVRLQWQLIGAVFGAIRTAVTVTVPGWFAFLRGKISDSWRLTRAGIEFYWGLIKAIFSAIKTAVTVTLPGWFTSGKNAVVSRWGEMRTSLGSIWASIRDNTFGKLKTFVTVTLPGAFATGVTAIRAAWSKVQDAARKPVEFVVRQVINPLISGYNSVAGVFGAPKANTISGFEAGGRIPGRPSRRDNMLASMVDHAGRFLAPMKVATGEYVVNAASTAKWLPTLDFINRDRGRSRGVDPARDGLPGFADGGLIDRIGGFFGKVKKGISGAADFVTNPAAGLRKIFDSAMARIPGGGTIVTMLRGMGSKIFGGIKEFLSGGMFASGGGASFGQWPSSPGAQRGDSGVWRRIVAMIRSFGLNQGSFGNGYRHGDPKWHGSGRAVDWMGFNMDTLAGRLARLRPLELIHRTNQRDYAYTRGRNKGSFSERLMEAHRNHIHIAMRFGGLVRRLTGGVGARAVGNSAPARLMDTGGRLRNREVAVNTSGHDEHVLTGGPRGDIDRLIRAVEDASETNRAILAALRGLGGEVADALERPTRRAVQLGRGRGGTVATGGMA